MHGEDVRPPNEKSHAYHTTNSFYRRMMHGEDVRPPNEKSHAYHLALLTSDVIFAY